MSDAPSPQEHFNYYTMDAVLGQLVFSLKYDVIGDQEHLRLLLRLAATLRNLCLHSPPSLEGMPLGLLCIVLLLLLLFLFLIVPGPNFTRTA